MKTKALMVIAISSTVFLTACEPKVGSESWCKAMKEKDKADWSASEAADFLKHCVVE